jgi:septal ring factor EnvC (AmiA/AmiB activator)
MKNDLNKILLIIISAIVLVLLIKSFIPEPKNDLLKYKLEQLDKSINEMKEQQKKIDEKIDGYKKEINKIDSNIRNIKSNRQTIYNYYEIKEDSIKEMERKKIIQELKKRYKY